MANEIVGQIQCAWCYRYRDKSAPLQPVRKNKNGNLYFSCNNCGQQFMNLPGGQAILEDNARTIAKQTIDDVRATLKPAPVDSPPPKDEPDEKPRPTHKPKPEPNPDQGGGFTIL